MAQNRAAYSLSMGDLQRIHSDEGKPRRRATEHSGSPWAIPAAQTPAKPLDEAPSAPGEGMAAIQRASFAANEVFEGYLDGCDRNNPPPTDNRSASYRHGFANARDDLEQRPRATAERLRQLAQEAAEQDAKA